MEMLCSGRRILFALFLALVAASITCSRTPWLSSGNAQLRSRAHPSAIYHGATLGQTKSLSNLPPFWVYCHLPLTFEQVRRSIHYPVVATLWDAFASAGFEVEYFNVTDNLTVMENILWYVRERKLQPVIWLLLWDAGSAQGMVTKHVIRAPSRRFGLLGAYTIMYNYEPKASQLQHLPNTAKFLRASEIWDYSRGNMRAYPNASNSERQFKFRHFPPGCAPALQYGVDWNAEVRDEKHIGFAGKWDQRTLQSRRAFNASGLVRDIYTAQTEDEWRQFLERYPVQLSTHSHFNKFDTFEGCRAAVLLSNGACLFAERSHPLDEEDFGGLVRFLSAEDASTSFPFPDSEEIRFCQERTKAAFCEKFHPAKLLQNSGFLDFVDSLRIPESGALEEGWVRKGFVYNVRRVPHARI